MSVATRKELLKHVKERYKKANWKEKSKILDEFCTLTSYGRKYPHFPRTLYLGLVKAIK